MAIANAQAEAKSVLVSESSDVQVELEIPELITQRIQYQEHKRQANIMSVVREAAEQLGDKEVDDYDVDHDWTAKFISEVQDVSSEDMQHLWAKVLAGEVEKPGSASIRTLQILRNMDADTANLFRRLCSLSLFVFSEMHQIAEARVPTLSGYAADNSLIEFGLGFEHLNRLNEHGLVIADYHSWCNYNIAISIWPGLDPGDKEWVIPFGFGDHYWILEPTANRPVDREFKLHGVALTNSGIELSRVVGIEPVQEFDRRLKEFWANNRLRMMEVKSPGPIRPEVLSELRAQHP